MPTFEFQRDELGREILVNVSESTPEITHAGDLVQPLEGNVISLIDFTTDNALIRADTPLTGNKNVQQSTITLSDSGNFSSSATLCFLSTVNAADAIKLLVTGGPNAQIHLQNTSGTSATGILIEGTASSGVTTQTVTGKNSMLSAGASSDSILINNTNATSGGITIDTDGTTSQILINSDRIAGDGILLQTLSLTGDIKISSQGSTILDAFSGLDVNALGGGANITLDTASTGGIALTHSGNFGTGIVLNSGAQVLLTSGVNSASAVKIEATNAFGGLDFDAGFGGMDFTTSGIIKLTTSAATVGAIIIDASGVSSGINIDSGTNGYNNLTTGQLLLTSSQSSTAAIRLNASNSAGGIDLLSGTGGYGLLTSGGIFISSSLAAANAIHLNAAGVTSGVDVDCGNGGFDLDSSGQISLVSTQSATDAIELKTTNNGDMKIDLDQKSNSLFLDVLQTKFADVSSSNYVNVTVQTLVADWSFNLPPAQSVGIKTLVNAGNGDCTWADPPLASGTVNGLQISDDTVTSKNIAAGKCRADDDLFDIISSGVLTPDFTNGVGVVDGLDTGVEAADTWYSIWIILNSTSGAVGSLLSISSTSPTLPTGFDKKRRIGWTRNNSSSNLYNYDSTSSSTDRFYLWNEAETVLQVLANGGATVYTNVDVSEFVPPTSTMLYLNGNHEAAGTGDFATFIEAGIGLTGLSPVTNPRASRCFGGSLGVIGSGSAVMFIRTSSSQAVEYANNSMLEDTDIWCLGYTDSI